MDIKQFIGNPQLVESLTSQQKTQLFQQLQTYQQTLQQDKIKLETELGIKQKEQAELFTKLQTETGQPDLESIQKHLSDLQSQFDTELQSILTDYQSLGG